MPTASTAQILGNNEAFEPITQNLYVRRVLSGEFVQVNRHLLRDLIERGLWTDDMRMQLIKLGAFLSPVGRATWDHWKMTRDEEFREWFEIEVYGDVLSN